MPDYQNMYLHLFNGVTDTIEMLDRETLAAEKLRQTQRECEEMYISDNGQTDVQIIKSAVREGLAPPAETLH